MNIIYFLNIYPTKHKLVAHDEMLEMSRRGHHINVVAVWGGEKDKISKLPFKVYYLENKICVLKNILLLTQLRKKYIQHLLLLKKYLGLQDSLKFLSSYRTLLQMNIDRIHTHFASNAALKGYLCSKFLGVPFSCTGHGSELLLYPEPYLKELILNAHPFITISNYNQKLLSQRYQIPSDTIKVNYCGVNPDYFKRSGLPYPDEFTIVSVTALREIKGIRYLIKACKILISQIKDYHCIIIGSGEEYEDLMKLVTDYQLENVVRLVGAIKSDAIRDYLLKASVFVLPSLSEGIPVAVMEAMSMELPVIATNITGLPEIIDDGVNGYLVPPQDPKALADKIMDLYKNPEKRTVFGKAARRKIEAKFNLKKNVARFEELLSQVHQE